MSVFLPGRSYVAIAGPPSSADLADVLPVDRLEIDGNEMLVKELRTVLGAVQQRPYGERRLLVITNADQLSVICQTTLLKALEEPPAFLIIILVVSSAEKLLPTVRSRLHAYHQPTSEPTKTESILPETEAAAANLLQNLKDRVKLTELLAGELQFQLNRPAASLRADRLDILERCLLRLERNSNQKLVIDWLLLHWFGQTGKTVIQS